MKSYLYHKFHKFIMIIKWNKTYFLHPYLLKVFVNVWAQEWNSETLFQVSLLVGRNDKASFLEIFIFPPSPLAFSRFISQVLVLGMRLDLSLWSCPQSLNIISKVSILVWELSVLPSSFSSAFQKFSSILLMWQGELG